MRYQKDPTGAFDPAPAVTGAGLAGASMSIAKPGGGESGTTLMDAGELARPGDVSEPMQAARATTNSSTQRMGRGTHPIRGVGAVLTCGRMYLLATVLR